MTDVDTVESRNLQCFQITVGKITVAIMETYATMNGK